MPWMSTAMTRRSVKTTLSRTVAKAATTSSPGRSRGATAFCPAARSMGCRLNTTSSKDFKKNRLLKSKYKKRTSLRPAMFAGQAQLRFWRGGGNQSSGLAPMTALMRRTPAEEDSSFWILKETSSAVLEACGPPQISLEAGPMV